MVFSGGNTLGRELLQSPGTAASEWLSRVASDSVSRDPGQRRHRGKAKPQAAEILLETGKVEEKIGRSYK